MSDDRYRSRQFAVGSRQKSQAAVDAVSRLIPHTIHQIYFGGESAAPENYRRWAATWREKHPRWRYEFWDAKRCRDLVATHYPWFLEIYDGYRHRIQRVDAVRCFILHRHGGVYADMDIECRRPIDDLVAGRDLLLGALGVGYTNAIMGSAPGHRLWVHAFQKMGERRHRFSRNAPLWSKLTMPMQIGYSTGPLMLTDCLRELGCADDPRVNVCPSWVFEPYAAGREGVDVSRSHGIHHMSMHWLPKRHKFMAAVLGVAAKLLGRRAKPAVVESGHEVTRSRGEQATPEPRDLATS